MIFGQHGAVRLIIQGAELGHAHQVHVLAGDETLDGLHTPPEHWCHHRDIITLPGSPELRMLLVRKPRPVLLDVEPERPVYVDIVQVLQRSAVDQVSYTHALDWMIFYTLLKIKMRTF